MREPVRALDDERILGVPPQLALAEQRLPDEAFDVGCVDVRAHVHRAVRWIVSPKEGRVDDEGSNHAGQAEPDDAPVVTRRSSSAGLPPSIHFPRSVYLSGREMARSGFSRLSFGAKNSSLAARTAPPSRSDPEIDQGSQSRHVARNYTLAADIGRPAAGTSDWGLTHPGARDGELGSDPRKG